SLPAFSIRGESKSACGSSSDLRKSRIFAARDVRALLLFLARFLQDSDIGAVLWPVCGLFRVNQIIEGNIRGGLEAKLSFDATGPDGLEILTTGKAGEYIDPNRSDTKLYYRPGIG